MIKNPILKGFNPDPSICRVGDDFYIATSTFEWYPGVQIHHSRDLVNWTLVNRPLKEKHLDMYGTDDSTGVWAPCLSYADNKFWLVFTNVRDDRGPYKDSPNYITTCETIDGEWSDPIYINSSGFDPSLFHDDDGRKYFVNVIWNHRVTLDTPATKKFGGIVLQEYCPKDKKLIGEAKIVTEGTPIGLTEGAHIYRKDGFYYLMVAEGGTVYSHSESVFRAKDIWGPYEEHPSNPILTAYYSPSGYIQKAGHASMCELDGNTWLMAHLCGRPLPTDKEIFSDERGFCPLGRETSLQYVEWKDGWPYLVGGPKPSAEIRAYKDVSYIDSRSFKENFQGPWSDKFQTLRIAPRKDDFKVINDKLLLRGRESLSSKYDQSSLFTRFTSFIFTAETKVKFNPTSFQQSAGLTCYYNTLHHTNIGLTYDETLGKCLRVEEIKAQSYRQIDLIAVDDSIEEVYLRVDVNYNNYIYSYSLDGKNFIPVKDSLETKYLSDDFIRLHQNSFFTGAFVGIYCYDMVTQERTAEFDYFSYQVNE